MARPIPRSIIIELKFSTQGAQYCDFEESMQRAGQSYQGCAVEVLQLLVKSPKKKRAYVCIVQYL